MLSKRYRLRKRGSFSYVRVHGTRKSESCISFVYIPGRCKRIGIVVSNKIGKAVKRNLVKRRMRGAAAELIDGIKNGQMVFSAKPGIEKLGYAEIKKQMESLLRRTGAMD